MTKRAIWLLAAGLVVVATSCATGGPSAEEQATEARWRDLEYQQHQDIERDVAAAMKSVGDLEQLYAKHCAEQSTTAQMAACWNLLMAQNPYRDEIRHAPARHREIEIRRMEREKSAESHAYGERIERDRQIQQAFQPRRQLSCKTEQWGKDFRTTCD